VKTFQNDGLTFEYLEWEAPPGAETVILLHGFPQPVEAWSGVADILSTQGYRVVAPRQRGYSPDATPDRIRLYSLEHLVADISSLVAHLEVKHVHLVGHDWGGCVSWRLIHGLDQQRTRRQSELLSA